MVIEDSNALIFRVINSLKLFVNIVLNRKYSNCTDEVAVFNARAYIINGLWTQEERC